MRFLNCWLPLIAVLLAVPAGAQDPWALPLLTGGTSAAAAREDDWLELHHAPLPAREGWRHTVSITGEDTLRLTEGPKRTTLSAIGWDSNAYYDRRRDGSLRYRSGNRVIDIADRDGANRDALHLTLDSATVFLASPTFGPWRAGLDLARVKADGHGTIMTLAGTFGTQPEPGLGVAFDQLQAVGRIERDLGRGGVFVAAGKTVDRTQVTIYDTHVQRVPLDYDGNLYQYGGWMTRGTTTVTGMLLTGSARGTDTLVYDGAANGTLTGDTQAHQVLLAVATPRSRYHLGYGVYAQSRQGFGIKPDASGWTVIVDGAWRIRDSYGEAAHIWPLKKGRLLVVDYGLHRLHLTTSGAYRGGYLGGLIETDRSSGSLSKQAWLHDLGVDLSTPIRRAGRLGYRGRITVPLADHKPDLIPSPPDDDRVGGGTTHTLYWDIPL